MSDQLSMFDQTICADSSSATSSLASAAGVPRCDSPDGPMTVPSGPVAAPVSRGALRAVRVVKPIRAIFGRSGSSSSASAALQSSLESRLRARTDVCGSIVFMTIWKRTTTPSGRSILVARASARPISDRAYGSWLSPDTDQGSPASDDLIARRKAVGKETTERLSRQVLLATWPTPTVRDFKDGDATSCRHVPINALLGRAVHLASGPTPSGSPAATAASGLLNPAHSRWLQGYPSDWDDSAPNSSDWQTWQALTGPVSGAPKPTASDVSAATATPSNPKSLRPSLRPISKIATNG